MNKIVYDRKLNGKKSKRFLEKRRLFLKKKYKIKNSDRYSRNLKKLKYLKKRGEKWMKRRRVNLAKRVR